MTSTATQGTVRQSAGNKLKATNWKGFNAFFEQDERELAERFAAGESVFSRNDPANDPARFRQGNGA
jgi:hypothetical protein